MAWSSGTALVLAPVQAVLPHCDGVLRRHRTEQYGLAIHLRKRVGFVTTPYVANFFTPVRQSVLAGSASGVQVGEP